MAYVFTKDVTFTIATGDGFCTGVFALKGALVAQGWTVLSSGTGSSGTYSSNSDLITTAALLNATKAWFRIQMPGGSSRQYTFQRTTNDYTWRIKVAPAGFATGSPAKDVTPGGATECIIAGSGTDASPTGTPWSTGTTTACRAHCIVDSASPYGALFLVHVQGTGAREAGWFHDPMVSGTYDASDTDPYVYGIHNANSNNAFMDYLFSSEAAYQAAVFVGGSSGIPVQCIAPSYGSTPDMGGTQYTVIPGGLVTNHISGYDDIFPMIWHRRAALAGGIGGQKGYSGLFYWNGTTRATGSTLTVSTTSDRYVIGHVNLPWDGTTPSV